jgi:hypothetical protein
VDRAPLVQPATTAPFPATIAAFWYVGFHTLVWLDLYLNGIPEEAFAPPAPFAGGELDSVAALPKDEVARPRPEHLIADVRRQLPLQQVPGCNGVPMEVRPRLEALRRAILHHREAPLGVGGDGEGMKRRGVGQSLAGVFYDVGLI